MLILFTFAMPYSMIEYHNNTINIQEKYVKEHGCKLIQVIPERVIGMMIHGETDIYKCEDGKILRIN